MQNKTIKFFISSTFKDFEVERNILQKFVFPELKELCHKNGFGFQPIDLRWGIEEEAGLDQQTMNICLKEIERSSYEPKPNLLLLVGQRYGWIPLPYEIEKEHFKKILNYHKNKDKTGLKLQYYPIELQLLNEWYEIDTNSKVTSYFLKDKHHLSREEWSKIEKQLRIALQEAFNKSFDEEFYKRIHTSATEQEMYLGLDAFDKTKNHEHTFAYFRTIEGYDKENKNTQDYIDEDLTKIEELTNKLQDPKQIPIENQINQTIKWNELETTKNIPYENLTLENTPKYLKQFHDEILEKFTTSIQTEIDNFTEQTQLQIELEQQANFLNEKSEIVLGRTTEVDRILDFITDSNEQFYLQYGKSGSGKTSVMAKAIKDLENKNSEYDIYYRFIGTSANSTYSRLLLENIYWQIESKLQNPKDIPKPHFEIEEREFKKQFKEQLKKLNDKKVVIFLDALDQFEDYNDLTILLEELPSNIKIVFSTLYDEKKKDNPDYSQYFNRLNYLESKYELEQLSEDINKEILEKRLESKNRELTETQWTFLNPFIQDITPLHLRLIFEIVKHWKSNQINLQLEDTQEKLIIQFLKFIQKQYHHKEELLQETLGIIAASKYGLSEEELIDLFSDNKEFLSLYQNYRYPTLNRLPNAIWSRFYFYIEPFFTEKLIDNEMLIKPYHRIIEEVIKDTYYKEDSLEFHKKLSTYFYTHQDKDKTWDERYYSLRMLSELPYQLYNSKNSGQLKEILFDLEFAGSVYNNYKQDGFRDIMSKATNLPNITEDEIYPWESFYREKEHLILKVDEELWRPYQSLFQLAYEDAEDSPLTREAVSMDINWLNYFSSRRIRSYKQNRTGLESYINLNKYNIPIQTISNIKLDNSLINIRVDKKKYFFDLKGTLKKIENSAEEHFEKNDKVYYHYDEENSILNIHHENNIYQEEVSLYGYRIFEFSRNKILLVTEVNIQLLSYTSNGFKKIGTFLSLLRNRTFFTNLGEEREPFEFYELENETIIGYHSKGPFIVQYIKNEHGTYEMYLHSGVHEGNSINGLVPLFEDYYLTYSRPDGVLYSGRFNESSPNTDILIWKNKNILGIFSGHAGVIKRIIKDKSQDNIIRLLTMSEDKSIKLLELGTEFTSLSPLNISFENKEKFFSYDYKEFNYDNLTNILREKNSWNLPNINIREIYFLNDKYIASLMDSNELFIFNSFVESIKEVKLSKIKEIDNEFYLFYGKNLKKLDTQINICTTRGYLTDIMRLTKDYFVASDSQGNLTLLKNGEKVFSKKVQKGFIPEIKYFSNSSNYFVTYSTMKHEVLFEDIEVKLWNSLNFINGYENPIILKINKKILRVDCLNYELKEYLLISTLDEIILYEFINSSIREIKKFSKSYINLFLLKNNKIVLSSSSSNIKKINNLKIVDLNCLENNLEINNIRLVQFQELNNDYFLGLCDNGALHLWNDNAEYIKSIKNRNIIYIFETSSLFAIDNRNRIIKYNNDLEEMSSSFFISENQFMNATYYSNKNWLLNFGTKILNIELDSKTVTENKRYWINNDLDNYDELSEDEKKIKKVNQIYISESRLSHEELQTYDKLDLFIKEEIIDFDEIFGINISREELDNSNIELILKSITLEDYDRILSEENEFYDKNLGFSVYILEQFLE